MTIYESIVKIHLIERIISEAKSNMKIDFLLRELAETDEQIKPNREINIENNCDRNILFSLIEYVIRMNMSTMDLLYASSSTGLIVKVTIDNCIIGVSYIFEKTVDSKYQIKLVFEE